jgi:hypothetical protein
MRNYYEEIDTVVRSFEDYKPYHMKSLEWASDRVCWCWRWKHITRPQMEELADRITKLFDERR